MNQTDARRMLLSLFPDGMGRWLDVSEQSDPWKVIDAAAAGLLAGVYGPLEDIEADANPITATESGIAAWEAALGLSQSTPALYGNLAQRRANVIARIREWGTPTLAAIKAALAALAGYEPAIIECDRSVLTGINERAIGSGGAINPGVNTYTATLGDNAPASLAGARLRINVSGVQYSELTITLTAPSGAFKTWTGFDDNAYVSGTQDYILAWPGAAGEQITGTWTLIISSVAGGLGGLDVSYLLVEGIGRAASGAEGYASNIYEWSAAINEATTASTYSREVAIETARRWNPAYTNGGVALYQTDGVLAALADDNNCLADLCVCA